MADRFGLALFNPDGTPSLAETGPFGYPAGGAGWAATVAAYEVLTPAGSVPGRESAGTSFSDDIAVTRTSVRASAVSGSALEKVYGTLMAAKDFPAALKPKTMAIGFSSSGLLAVGYSGVNGGQCVREFPRETSNG